MNRVSWNVNVLTAQVLSERLHVPKNSHQDVVFHIVAEGSLALASIMEYAEDDGSLNSISSDHEAHHRELIKVLEGIIVIRQKSGAEARDSGLLVSAFYALKFEGDSTHFGGEILTRRSGFHRPVLPPHLQQKQGRHGALSKLLGRASVTKGHMSPFELVSLLENAETIFEDERAVSELLVFAQPSPLQDVMITSGTCCP